MIKVVNISNKTIYAAYTEIKPKKIHIFETLTEKDKLKLLSMNAVNIVRVYYVEDNAQNENTAILNVETTNDTTTTKKSTRKSNKKKQEV